MTKVFNQLTLRDKLLLFAIIPLTSLIILASCRVHELIIDYQAIEHEKITINIVKQVTAAIDAAANEQHTEQSQKIAAVPSFASLSVQQNRTYKATSTLIHSQFIQQLLASSTITQTQKIDIESRLTQIKVLNDKLIHIKVSLNNHDEIHGIYQSLYEELFILLNQLKTQLRYIRQARAYNDLLNLINMQHLAVKERYLVSHLLGEKNFIYRDYLNIENLIFEQQQTLYYAFIVANPNRKELIQQLYNSREQKKLIEFRQLMQRQADIVEQAQRIGNSLGYGGLMHDYKNFLLTGLPSYAEDFARHPSKVNVQLAQLQNQPLSPKQQQATSEIEQKIAEYQQQMLALKKLKQENLPIHEINQRTKIDEQALTKALHYLQNPPLLIDPLQWQQVTSARLNHIQQITANISDYMYRLANKQQSYVLFSLLSYLIIGSLILIVSLLILRTIIKNLMNKINVIVTEMSRMAQDPKLDLILNVDGKDELNQMVESFNHMVIERQKASHYLRQAAAVFKYASEGIIVTDANNNIELINPAFTEITGYSIEEIRGKNPSILQSKRHSQAFYEDIWRSLNNTGKWEGEIWNTRKNGQVYPEYLAITLVRNDQGEVIQHLGMFLDISNRKQYEQNIWFQTHFDSLTELPNRKLFNDRLNHELTLAKKYQRKLTIILIDLDRFKNINDTLGHHFGDELLKQVALRLNNTLEKRPFVARFSGDEFAILITDYDDDIEIDHNIKQLMDSFALSFKLDNEDIIISASMGVALYPQDGLDHKSITSNAETAMYQAKETGRNSYKYFTAGMNSNLLERMTIEQKLRKAVMQSEFCLHYQPIVDMNNGHIIGLEALIRWVDPVVGIIPPDTFITIAEETGMIETIGAWVLNQAIADLAKLNQLGFKLSVAINVSTRQCINNQTYQFEQLLAATIKKHQVAATDIHIEITESMLMTDDDINMQTLTAIRSLGCQIYMDDFGTGYSSLSYLKRFPINVIKIDRSFIENSTNSHADKNLIAAIVSMGQSLEMKLVAEGIETLEQWQYLQQLGCNFAQGYLLSKPLPFDTLVDLLSHTQQQSLLPHTEVAMA